MTEWSIDRMAEPGWIRAVTRESPTAVHPVDQTAPSVARCVLVGSSVGPNRPVGPFGGPERTGLGSPQTVWSVVWTMTLRNGLAPPPQRVRWSVQWTTTGSSRANGLQLALHVRERGPKPLAHVGDVVQRERQRRVERDDVAALAVSHAGARVGHDPVAKAGLADSHGHLACRRERGACHRVGDELDAGHEAQRPDVPHEPELAQALEVRSERRRQLFDVLDEAFPTIDVEHRKAGGGCDGRAAVREDVLEGDLGVDEGLADVV